MDFGSGWLLACLAKLSGMTASPQKIRRGCRGLGHERSLLGDLIYAKVAEIDEKCFDQRSREHVQVAHCRWAEWLTYQKRLI